MNGDLGGARTCTGYCLGRVRSHQSFLQTPTPTDVALHYSLQKMVFLNSLLLLVLLTATTPAAVAGDGDDDLPMTDVSDEGDTDCRTPQNIEQLFLTACNETIKDADTCASAWDAFSSAFASKDPTTVEPGDYDEYFNILKVTSAPNTVLFWSAVQHLVGNISSTPSADITSSFTVPASVIINKMASQGVSCWCGGESGIDYTNPCPRKPYLSFFGKFSCLLAESAAGVTFWVGYGERENGTYQPGTFFSEYEFPKLMSSKVTKLAVIDVHRLDMGESCGNGTLAQLQNEAMEKFGENGFSCYDVCGDPRDQQEIPGLATETLKIISEEQG